MNASCRVLCGMPSSLATALHMFDAPAANSFAEEWVRGTNVSPHSRVEAYMNDLPLSWIKMSDQLPLLNVQPIPDATSDQLSNSLSECDVTILIAHHVQLRNMSSVGIELADGVLPTAEIPNIAPKRATIVDLLGVCRSESFIPLLKHNCDATRVIARQTPVNPIEHFRLVLNTVRLWRQTGSDYVDAVFRIRMAMLDALNVKD